MCSTVCIKLMRSLGDVYSPNMYMWINLYIQITINVISSIKRIGDIESKRFTGIFSVEIKILAFGKKNVYLLFNKKMKL